MQGQTYSGPERMLLIAFHLGVTCARVCYSILDPGAEIEIKDIQRFPKGGSSMVQCIVYYDKEGSVRAIGEIGPDPIQVIAREEKFLRVPVDWSTLQNTNENPGVTLPPLGKSPEDVLSDFLTYLKNEVHTYIRNDHPSIGIAVLDSATHYTFIAPSKMNETVIRVAAKKAEIIKDEKDTACMTFITEEEAYFETYLEERCDAPTGEERGVCIVNIDHALLTFSSFSYKSQPQRVEAITESQCDLKGYSVVKEEARAKITSLMKGSKLERKISAMLEYFDNTTKPAFREINRDPVVISFSGGKHRDLTRGIKAGKLYLDTNTVASFFEPLIKSIIEGVLAQNRVAREPIFDRALITSSKKQRNVWVMNFQMCKCRGSIILGPVKYQGVALPGLSDPCMN